MASVSLVAGLATGWVRLYTAALPTDLKIDRRAEIESDLWEQQHDVSLGIAAATHLVARLIIGMPGDLWWTLESMTLKRAVVWRASGLCLLLILLACTYTTWLLLRGDNANKIPPPHLGVPPIPRFDLPGPNSVDKPVRTEPSGVRTLPLPSAVPAIVPPSPHPTDPPPTPPPPAVSGAQIMIADAPGDVGAWSSVHVDATGRVTVIYYDATNGRMKTLHCGNPDCNAANTVTSLPHWGIAVLDAAGNPVFVRTNEQLEILHCGNPACDAGNTTATPEANVNWNQPSALVLDPEGNPVVVYLNIFDFENNLRVLHCGNPTCTAGNTIAAPGTEGYVGAVTSLVLDSWGNPVISYGCGGGLRVLHCGNPTCTAGNTIATPDTAAGPPSLVLDSSGNPVVVYAGDASGNLKVLRCGNPNCTAGNTITPLDTGGSDGQFSLALDRSGHPLLSYTSNGQLKVLRCGNPACTAGNTIATPDPGVQAGQQSSLTLSADDNPIVSYYDVTRGDLRLLFCADPACRIVPVSPAPGSELCWEPVCVQFSIVVDVNGDGLDDCSTHDGNAAECSIPEASTFTLNVNLDSLGEVQGYGGFDLYVEYDGVTSMGNPDAHAWPDCAFGAVADPERGRVAWGCTIGTSAEPSAYVGLIGTTDFDCASSGTIRLVHGSSFTTLVDDYGSHHEGEWAAETLTIDCAAPAVSVIE